MYIHELKNSLTQVGYEPTTFGLPVCCSKRLFLFLFFFRFYVYQDLQSLGFIYQWTNYAYKIGWFLRNIFITFDFDEGYK